MAVKILGGDTLAGVDVDSTPKAVRVIQTGPRDGGELLIDGFLNKPSVGSFFSCAGAVAAVVAASITAGSTLAFIRLQPMSNRFARILQWDVQLIGATTNATGDVAGSLCLCRFSGGTPTGGTDRTAGINLMDESGHDPSHCSVMDSNAALTVGTVDFGTQAVQFLKGLEGVAAASTQSYAQQLGSFQRRLIVPNHAFPLILMPGDGLALRVQVAFPTGTWMYAYTIVWEELRNENDVEQEV